MFAFGLLGIVLYVACIFGSISLAGDAGRNRWIAGITALFVPLVAVVVYLFIRDKPSRKLAALDEHKRQRLAADAEAREAKRQNLSLDAAHTSDAA
jgi:uncharacterized membrane protein YedE/YeeE